VLLQFVIAPLYYTTLPRKKQEKKNRPPSKERRPISILDWKEPLTDKNQARYAYQARLTLPERRQREQTATVL
jgi:hypothetical protein